MPEDPANERGHFVLVHGEVYEAISVVTKCPVVESFVAGEERWAAAPQQQRDDGLVGHAMVPDMDADLPGTDTPALQEEPLALGNVFVEKVHAGFVPSTNSSV